MAANKPKRWIFGLDFILFVRWCFVSHVHLWWFWIYHIIKHDRFQRMGSASWKMDTVHYTVGCLKFYFRPQNFQNTRISTWKMMRCGGKFLWILNWVKGSQVKRRILGNSLMLLLSFTATLLTPARRFFMCCFSLVLRRDCGTNATPTFLYGLSYCWAEPCLAKVEVASLLKNWIALVLLALAPPRVSLTYEARWPYVLRCIEMFLSSILGKISGPFFKMIFLKIFE